MLVFSVFFWIVQRAFSCNHLRTTVNEGKCYCPDCGRGLIYHWVVLRCGGCRARLDSRTILRQVMPLHRCCPQCGESATQMDRLESPAYFHLHKAQLMVQEEADYLQSRFGWGLRSVAEVVRQTVADTWVLLQPAHAPVKMLACFSTER
ncbi:hypothetical protein [Vampirovibrio sp.]|uniref:hypothetical protein n=1 Tax=Vampirovibrio sp. TaxID=2717857 RepID=UPI003593FE50